ncbi:MAG: TatD family hydrolase [Candidatus Beckwithbacteria bacterium]
MYIDTHTHLNLKAFEDDWREVADRAKKAEVNKMLVVGTNLESSQKAIEIAEDIEGLFAVVGFHPHHCKGIAETQIDKIMKGLEKLAKHKKVVAIGECGLDYHVYQKTKYTKVKITEDQKKLQKQVFGKQIQLAKELNLPMVIHNREAQKDILDVMDHFCLPAQAGKNDGKYPKGVFHCISGSIKFLKQLLERGFYIGVDGNVTYSSEVEALVKETPLDRLLLETDSPWLIPRFSGSSTNSNPKRSGLKASLQERTLIDRWRNTPSNVKIVAEFVAKLKNTSINQIAKKTTINAERLFNI